jgi:hypothetical protein
LRKNTLADFHYQKDSKVAELFIDIYALRNQGVEDHLNALTVDVTYSISTREFASVRQ